MLVISCYEMLSFCCMYVSVWIVDLYMKMEFGVKVMIKMCRIDLMLVIKCASCVNVWKEDFKTKGEKNAHFWPEATLSIVPCLWPVKPMPSIKKKNGCSLPCRSVSRSDRRTNRRTESLFIRDLCLAGQSIVQTDKRTNRPRHYSYELSVSPVELMV